ncbi:ATP-dependent DNA helicase [Stanieria cyanosphaera PCC 7437]|uniref:ATP-dependent DNA helicase n=1 Tax=Stanieria cyanosphaera (strain ATCC 29371 / PCC 7437) TaxID=111780 RepID=K9XWE8_STAC7|nr:helicase C-terminal domain-containing protein [Stanieria cyanosphaera]AFZ36863.1 ATP-dependent DNA helicase [Stanieria cyanosphaera PCC 7437]
MIEVEVHSSLRDFLREQNKENWPHHLTMARLVARALRLSRPALIQTGSSVGKYCLSYLMPALVGDWSVIIVAPEPVQFYLIEDFIPALQAWLGTHKNVRIGERWKNTDHLLLTTPQIWLRARINQSELFPAHIPTIIDCADNLEDWVRQELTVKINRFDWEELSQNVPEYAELIREFRIKLTKAIFSRPVNPYECYLLEPSEQENLFQLLQTLAKQQLLTPKLNQFWHQWQQPQTIIWTAIARNRGEVTLYTAPADVASLLSPIWQQQPIVLIGSFLDLEANAPIYRQQLGIGEILSLKFSPNRQNEHINLYLPDRLPLPNTPQFRQALIEQTQILVNLSSQVNQSVVILIDDVPLKAQVGTFLAAEFGSRVRVEQTNLAVDGILISGWEFWCSHQTQLPTPQLLIIATLPLPSLENPLVASRVAYYKSQRQDWFRLYLLPSALRKIQQAILPLRESQGVVALLDNRVNYRSYGKTILTALEPCARINFIDPTWFNFAISE